VGAAVNTLSDSDESHGHEAERSGGHGDGHGEAPEADAAAAPPAGLAVEQGGYRLEPEATALPLGRDAEIAYRISAPDGAAVTDFDVEHERRMHLIVVRRDLTGFQHLHPKMDASGRWSVRLRVPRAGVYRAYADFTADGQARTLATDLVARGPFTSRALPAPVPTDMTAGYTATLAADGLEAGADAELAYDIRRDGRPVDDLEPYLGADGHLVALREGDLAFLHVHPEESATPGRISFGASLPSPGRYRLYLQFSTTGS
jgi:hypothetical protein